MSYDTKDYERIVEIARGIYEIGEDAARESNRSIGRTSRLQQFARELFQMAEGRIGQQNPPLGG